MAKIILVDDIGNQVTLEGQVALKYISDADRSMAELFSPCQACGKAILVAPSNLEDVTCPACK